jgi:hypothetical protein
VGELIRELVGEAADFDARDAIERAAFDLSAVGLIHLCDHFVSRTRAAVRLSELHDW